jgi:dienelactone hydrolase
VVLHGYYPSNPAYHDWWEAKIDYISYADRFGAIMIYPMGRYNASYQGIGEQDVVRCVEMAKQQFSVDEDHVYLSGYSMGGRGTWYVGTRHPELFAALGPYFGGGDYHVYLSEQDIAQMTPRERFMSEMGSSFAQADQLLNLPVWAIHGDSDQVVDINNTYYIVKMLERWGYEVRYREFPGKGHELFGGENELYPWLLQHKRVTDPKQVRVRSAWVKSASAYWVKVERSIEPWKFIHATAEVVGPNCIRLDTDNVSVITLSPGKALVDSSQPIKVTWNDVAYTVKLDNNRKATLKNASYTPSQLEKKPLLEGPINDVITTPFAFVTGTISSDPLMLAYCESYTKPLVDDWKVWQHATPRYFKDTEISEQDLKQYSLILIGGPDANLISKRFSKQIPLELKSDAVVIDGNSIPAKDAAVCMIYPHPLNSDRYVMINAATSAQGMSYLPGLRHNMYSYDYGKCPHAHKISQDIITLPLHLELTREDIEKIAGVVNNFTVGLNTY